MEHIRLVLGILLEEQAKIGRIIKKTIWGILPLVSLSFVMQSCDENKFPVTPVPDQFEFIPPNDVNMLSAKGGDGQISLTWDAAVENTLKAVHVTNQNTGEEKVLPGTANEVTFTGLTNYEKYTFLVKTESLQEQLSYGATISAKPFVADNIKPGVVVNLVGYKLGDNTAFVVWESPEDNDIEKFIIALGTETITVDAETTYGTIYGNLSQPLKVYAVDYSGNTSDAAETMANAAVVTIDGFDDGDTETVQIHKDPIISAVDGYVITYFGQEYRSEVSPLPEVYSQTMPVDNDQPLWLDGDKTQGSWLEPVKVTLLSGGKEISTYEYLTYNNIPGTLMGRVSIVTLEILRIKVHLFMEYTILMYLRMVSMRRIFTLPMRKVRLSLLLLMMKLLWKVRPDQKILLIGILIFRHPLSLLPLRKEHIS